MSLYDPMLDPVGVINCPKSREAFETAFKETNEYKLHIELGFEKENPIFERVNSSGDYYHPSVALAWKFYELGAK